MEYKTIITCLMIAIFALAALMFGTAVVFAVDIYNSHPLKIDNMNITIVEKTPAGYSYTERLGEHYRHIEPPTIFDDKGDLYIVANENDWAKMRVNQTYNVKYASYPNAQKGKIIGINHIIGDI